MQVNAIRDEASYQDALKKVSRLIELDPAPDSPDGERLDVLGTLVQAYEAKHHPVDLPDPIEAIRFRMEQQGLQVGDLEPMIGARNRVYEVMAKRRPLTIGMIRRLNKGLNIPAEVLIQESAAG